MSEPPDIIAQAVKLLKRGELVSFPTETVYGLGADASNPEALAKLYRVKGRPASHPVIVHLGSVELLRDWANSVPDNALRLAERFWPGPLTLILPRAKHVLDQVTGGQDTVALRMPDHPLALALLSRFEGGIAAPSANKFGRLSPTCASDVRFEFGEEVALVLDGGPCEVGIESTILDLSCEKPMILRPGMISKIEIEEVIGQVHSKIDGRGEMPPPTRAPGTLASHYAPSTPLHLVKTAKLASTIRSFSDLGNRVAVLSFTEPPGDISELDWIVANPDPIRYARQLYSNLRYLDHLGCDRIVVENVPRKTPWHGIQDRLQRAAQKPD